MASLQGRHALVTGGGRGIGRAIAAALTQAGAAVTIAGRNEKALADVVGQGEAAGYVIADVTDAKAVDSGVQQAVAARGPVDLLIANAGTATAVPFAKATPDQFRDMFELHVLGMLHPVQAVLGGMIERGFGRIVAVASIVGLAGLAERVALHHRQARHGRTGALDRAGDGGLGRHRQRRVPGLCRHRPDPRRRSIGWSRRAASKEDALARFTSRVPVGRLVRPEEVAEAVLYFCSPAAAATTGATLVIGADGA